MYCRAEGALTFECQKRTLGTLVFVCPRADADFRKFAKSEMLVGGNGARSHRPRRHHSLRSCPGHAFEGFDKNYARPANFHRPKLKLAAVTFFGFPVFEQDLEEHSGLPRPDLP